MWGDVLHMGASLRFEHIEGSNLIRWKWLDLEGKRQEALYSTHQQHLPRTLDTVDLQGMRDALMKGSAFQCVAGPSGLINLGTSVCIRGDEGWIRAPWMNTWVKYTSGINQMLQDLKVWPANSRWYLVEGP